MSEVNTTGNVGTHKITAQVAKFSGEGASEQGAVPYEVVSSSGWYDADGTEITDEARIVELEAKLAENQEGDVPCP